MNKTYCKICGRREKGTSPCDPIVCPNAGTYLSLDFKNFKITEAKTIKEYECEFNPNSVVDYSDWNGQEHPWC